MSHFGLADFALQVSRGLVTGIRGVNKFGRSVNVDQIATDIIDDVANVIWDAPTTARLHNIVSTSSSDDGDPAGVGARTLRILGLTSWDAVESTEDIILNGSNPVVTDNSYVVIHRMFVLTKGGTSTNVGTITATAQTDGTITAMIKAGLGQTQMAVYGVPSVQTAFMTDYYSSANRLTPTAASVDVSLLVNPEPDSELTNFLIKHTQSLNTPGSSYFLHRYNPYFAIPGPAIVKIQAISSANDSDVSAGFDLFIVDN